MAHKTKHANKAIIRDLDRKEFECEFRASHVKDHLDEFVYKTRCDSIGIKSVDELFALIHK